MMKGTESGGPQRAFWMGAIQAAFAHPALWGFHGNGVLHVEGLYLTVFPCQENVILCHFLPSCLNGLYRESVSPLPM